MNGGFGGMVSFELNDNMNSDDFVKSLEVIQPTMSLAGVESTITSPIQTSHKKMNSAERDKIGITKNLLRLSISNPKLVLRIVSYPSLPPQRT